MRQKIFVLLALSTPCSLVSPVASAFDVSWAPAAEVIMRVDDNLRWQNGPHPVDVGFDTGVGGRLKAEDEGFSSELIPHILDREFPIGNEPSADEYSLGFNNLWLKPDYTAGANVAYGRDSTLTTNIADRGRQNAVGYRKYLNVSPNVNYAWSDRLNFQASVNYSDVSYSGVAGTGLQNYNYLSPDVGVIYRWNSDLSLNVDLFASNFSVPDSRTTRPDQKSRALGIGGQFGFSRQLSDTLQVSGSAGWVSTDIDYRAQHTAILFVPEPALIVYSTKEKARAHGPIASFELKKIFENDVADFSYSRQLSPSGRGSESISDVMTLVLTRALSSYCQIVLNGTYQMRASQVQSGGFSSSATDLNLDYAEMGGTIKYQVTDTWTFGARYSHAYSVNTYAIKPISVEDNALYLTITYAGVSQKLWSDF